MYFGVLGVHAHPDDEAIWTGGTLARYADEGARTAVVTCTWAAGPRRAGELARISLEHPRRGQATVLGYADAGEPESAPAAPASWTCRSTRRWGRVVEHIREFGPTRAHLRWVRVYGDSDHVHVHRVTWPRSRRPAMTSSTRRRAIPGDPAPSIWRPCRDLSCARSGRRSSARLLTRARLCPASPTSRSPPTSTSGGGLSASGRPSGARDRGGPWRVHDDAHSLPEQARAQLLANEWYRRVSYTGAQETTLAGS